MRPERDTERPKSDAVRPKIDTVGPKIDTGRPKTGSVRPKTSESVRPKTSESVKTKTRVEPLDEEVIPSTSGVVGAPDKEPAKVFPALDEVEPEVELKHQLDGHMCGGHSTADELKQLMRLVTSIDFTKSVQGETAYVTYITNEEQLVSAIESVANREKPTLYTLVALFRNKATPWKYTIKTLLKKKEYFTSFRHFLKEFRETQWPNQEQTALIEAEQCEEKVKESIEQYYERFVQLQEMAGLDPEKRIEAFIAGLKDEDVRKEVRYEKYEPNTRTLEKVKNHAVQVKTQKGVAKMMDARARNRVPRDSVAATTRTTPSTTRAGPSTSRTMPSMSRAGPSASRGSIHRRPWAPTMPRKRYEQPSRSTATRTTKPSTTASAVNDMATRVREVRRAMRARAIKGCYGCLEFEHRFLDDFRYCPKTCAFCGIEFRNAANRHMAFECRKLPRTRAEIVEKVRQQKERNSRQR